MAEALRRVEPRRFRERFKTEVKEQRAYAGIPGGRAIENDTVLKAEVDHITQNNQGTLINGGYLTGFGTFAWIERPDRTWLMLARAENSERVAHAVFLQPPSDLQYYAKPLLGCSQRYQGLSVEKMNDDWRPIQLSRAYEHLQQRLAALANGSAHPSQELLLSRASSLPMHTVGEAPKHDMKSIIFMSRDTFMGRDTFVGNVRADRNPQGDMDIVVGNSRARIDIRDIKLRGVTAPWGQLLQAPTEKNPKGGTLYQLAQRVLELRIEGKYYTPRDMATHRYTLEEFNAALDKMDPAVSHPQSMNVVPIGIQQRLSSLDMTDHDGQSFDPGTIPARLAPAKAKISLA